MAACKELRLLVVACKELRLYLWLLARTWDSIYGCLQGLEIRLMAAYKELRLLVAACKELRLYLWLLARTWDWACGCLQGLETRLMVACKDLKLDLWLPARTWDLIVAAYKDLRLSVMNLNYLCLLLDHWFPKLGSGKIWEGEEEVKGHWRKRESPGTSKSTEGEGGMPPLGM